MRLVKEGKTKTVFDLEDGTFLLKFKDDVTGENGVFDPGANAVGLTIEGAGLGGLRLTDYFFKAIQAAGIPTHYVSADLKEATMVVRPATFFGEGLEVICRFRAVGSFMRRYASVAKEGQKLDALVEMTLKDDDRGDPLITQDALEALGVLKCGEYQTLKELTQKISRLVKELLAAKGMELYDIKLEFGRAADGELMLIDEISAGSLRAYKGAAKVEPLDLVKLLLD